MTATGTATTTAAVRRACAVTGKAAPACPSFASNRLRVQSGIRKQAIVRTTTRAMPTSVVISIARDRRAMRLSWTESGGTDSAGMGDASITFDLIIVKR